MFHTTHSTSVNFFYSNTKSSTNLDGLDYRQARYCDSEIGLFLSVDPLGDYFTNYSTYHYAFNNPVRFIDPDGMAGQDFIVLSQSGKELRRIKMEGEDRYVKVNESAFNQASSRFDNDVEEYNTILTVWSLRLQQWTSGKTGLIFEQTGIGLSITGSMREGNNLIGDVTVLFQVLEVAK